MERKSTLKQTAYNTMKQNSRSINLGYNPNDDYNETNSQRWFIYSDYYYREGSVIFESIDDLFEKIKSIDLAKVQAEMKSHNTKNKELNKLCWKSIVRYLGDTIKGKMPRTFQEGMDLWKHKNKPPQFIPKQNNVTGNTTVQHWVVISQGNGNRSNSLKTKHKNILLHVTNRSIDNQRNYSVKSQIVLTQRDVEGLQYRIVQNDAFSRYPKYLPGVIYSVSKGARGITLPGGKNLEYHVIWMALDTPGLHPDTLVTTAISLAFHR